MGATVDLTDLIQRAQTGDDNAIQQVFDAAYEELRALARARLRAGSKHLLDTTSLVHEAYLRFANSGRLHIGDREHFLRYASHVMRSVIVDFVRERARGAARWRRAARHAELRNRRWQVRRG